MCVATRKAFPRRNNCWHTVFFRPGYPRDIDSRSRIQDIEPLKGDRAPGHVDNPMRLDGNHVNRLGRWRGLRGSEDVLHPAGLVDECELLEGQKVPVVLVLNRPVRGILVRLLLSPLLLFLVDGLVGDCLRGCLYCVVVLGFGLAFCHCHCHCHGLCCGGCGMRRVGSWSRLFLDRCCDRICRFFYCICCCFCRICRFFDCICRFIHHLSCYCVRSSLYHVNSYVRTHECQAHLGYGIGAVPQQQPPRHPPDESPR
ncbi:hypothetical protein F5Y17DRAFT_264184 [Xylariaceae sp. FL0594]|nr:hypothetical protein F5Y17DRAFT_264184 [Xylariaceae sp. FL0594]